jgi:hypothetical protein
MMAQQIRPLSRPHNGCGTSHTALDQSDMTSLLCIPAHQSLANASQRRSHNTNPESLAAEPGLMSRELGAEGGTNPKLTPFFAL